MRDGRTELTEDEKRDRYIAFHEALSSLTNHIITVTNALPEGQEELKRELNGLIDMIQILRKELWSKERWTLNR